MDSQNAFPIEKYIDIILRRKWFILVPFCLSLIITPLVYWKLPKIYRSDTLILVLPQNIPVDYVRPTITASIETRLATITEEILSRTRLETIIEEFNLYRKARLKAPMDRIVDRMRKDIQVEIGAPKRGEEKTFFKIYYEGENPETVCAVTNRLASLFIRENLKTREQQAQITTEFLDKELREAKGKLEELEKAIGDFKLQHIGLLPEQNSTNLEMLNRLVEQRRMVSESLGRAEEQYLIIQQQLADRGKMTNEEDPVSLQEQLQNAKNELLSLQGMYTDNHISVRKVKERIRQLEENLLSFNKNAAVETPGDSPVLDPVTLDLKNRQITGRKEIERLKKEESEIREQIQIYEKRVENAPSVELQLAALTRDYNNTKEFYEELLRKKMEAEQAESLEKRQQGEQFKILDPASFPSAPYKPNQKKVFLLGILLGLGTGCGLAFLAEMTNDSFRTVKEVEDYLGVPVLVTIPLIEENNKAHDSLPFRVSHKG